MKATDGSPGRYESSAAQPSPALVAKARMLAWAAEHDAVAARASWKIGMRVAAGAAATIGGLTLVRALSPRKRWGVPVVGERGRPVRSINWALVARAGIWLVPRAISAVQSASRRRRAI